MTIVKILFLAGAMTVIASQTLAQTPAATGDAHGLATPTGHDVNVSVSGYRYVEPGTTSISIAGAKIGGEYTGTFALSARTHWFIQGDVRGNFGNTTYTGWCSPFFIAPNSSSPNGYEVDIGDPSPCSESGDKDWYVEGRALVGKDLIRERWGLAPFTGVGLRHLSNGVTGVVGYRTDDYLYLPVGLTARTTVGSRQHALSLTVEVDALLHGWQKTRDSQLGSGVIPATTIAPAFSIDGFTDISFTQKSGFAPRASVKYQITRMWSLEPYYVYWNVSASPVNYETLTFTVNNLTAREQRGAYEPDNHTHEVGVKVGLHF
jgi:hypothetical protein